MTQRNRRWHLLALSLILPVLLLTQTSANAAVDQRAAIGYKAAGNAGQVTINDSPVLVIKGTKDPVQKARAVAKKLNELQQGRQLRPDQIVPALSGGRYEVRVGKQTLLVVDPAMAKAEKSPPAQVAMRMINQLRQSLGGVPFESQASRSLMAGGRELRGEASWYGGHFHGRYTSSGERYNMHMMTCAHRSLPFGTLLLVTNPGNGRSVLVKVNDRGPFIDTHKRIIDLSPAAFRLLAPLNAGVIGIKAQIVSMPR